MRVGVTPLLTRYARTTSARAWESRRFVAAEPVPSVYPAISIRIAGFATNDCATMLSTVKDSSCSTARPGSNVTPRRMTGVRSGVNRITQPFASTRLPGGVPGHLSRSSGTPSPSESLKRGHPVLSTSVPGGVLGHLSIPSGTPSLSESSGHRSEEHTSELQSQSNLVCRLLLEKKKKTILIRDISELLRTWPHPSFVSRLLLAWSSARVYILKLRQWHRLIFSLYSSG